MAKELTYSINVIVGDTVKPFDELTENEYKQLCDNARERLSNSLSTYFTQHPDEYKKIREVKNDTDNNNNTPV